MKRITILLTVAFLCSVGFAQETEDNNQEYSYKTFTGGFWSCTTHTGGGYGEFGFRLIPEDKNFVLRNCIMLGGEGGYISNRADSSFGGFFLGDKIIVGSLVKNNCSVIRSYGFLGGKAEMFSAKDHSFFNPNLMYGINAGGGFELQFVKNAAFAVEFGGTVSFVAGPESKQYSQFTKGTPTLTIGYRSLY